MKRLGRSLVLSTALVAGFALAGSARAEEASEHSGPANQAEIADATFKLEDVFAKQFARGEIDREALAAPISAVLSAVPELARPQTEQHIERVLQTAQSLVKELTPEEREKAAAPPQENVGTAKQEIIMGWGWPGALGWGGYGAFGFPMMGYGLGWGTGLGYGGLGYGGWGGLGYGGWGGLGWGGLGWGGLGYGGFGGLGWGRSFW